MLNRFYVAPVETDNRPHIASCPYCGWTQEAPTKAKALIAGLQHAAQCEEA